MTPTLLTCLLVAAAAQPARTADAVARARAEAEARSEAARALAPVRGMVLGVFSDADSAGHEKALREIRTLGASHVLLVVPHGMETVSSETIRPRPWLTPSDRRLREIVRAAHGLGLRTVLMPTLFIEKAEEGDWRGIIAPASWNRWWAAYEALLVRFARLSDDLGVAVLCVGSELCSTEEQTQRWARAILAVRRETESLLTYSFNWDHASRHGLAELVNLAGINAYFDLGEAPGTPVAEMVGAWKRARAGVEAWRRDHGRPLLLTEVGFRSITSAELSPWDYTLERGYDGTAQARCYESFTRAWADAPDLLGAFFYEWRGAGGPGDTGYTPRGKPAEAIARRYFREADTRGRIHEAARDDHDPSRSAGRPTARP